MTDPDVFREENLNALAVFDLRWWRSHIGVPLGMACSMVELS